MRLFRPPRIGRPNLGDQYQDTGWFSVAFTALLVFFVLFNIHRAKNSSKKGSDLFIRRIPGLNAIDEAVGRATEMGRPVLMVPGLSDPINAKAMQALNIFSYVSRTAARFSNPILLCAFSASLYTVAQEIIRDVYNQEGLSDKFDTDSVRFISDRQFAFAAGVSGLVLREKVAAAFLMGEFYAESLIFAETANSVGAIQVASSTEVTQTPFFIAACDYVLIGDEFYAASAYLTRAPVLVGSLIGQDWSKVAIAATVFFGMLTTSVQMLGTTTREKKDGKFVDIRSRPVKKSDTFLSQYLNPQKDPTLKIERPKLPKDQLPGGGDAAGGAQ